MPVLNERYEIHLKYTVANGTDVLEHTHKTRVNIAEPPIVNEDWANILVKLRDVNTPTTLDAGYDPYIALLKPMFAPQTTFGLAYLYKIPQGGGLKQLIALTAYDEVGTGAAARLGDQAQLTIKCDDASNFYLKWMESELQLAADDTPPYVSADVTAIANFAAGANSPFLSYRGGLPVFPAKLTNSPNEALFYLRFR